MNAVLLTRGIASAGYRRAVVFGLIGALLMGIMVVNAVTTTNLGTESIRLGRETFSDDTDVTVVSQRIFEITTADEALATGDTAPGVEASNLMPQVNTDLEAGNKAYQFEVKEATATSWQVGENFKIKVFIDEGGGPTIIETLYTKQDTVNDAAVEGVLVTPDSSNQDVIGQVFSIVITQQ